jgi:hypothetical protein
MLKEFRDIRNVFENLQTELQTNNLNKSVIRLRAIADDLQLIHQTTTLRRVRKAGRCLLLERPDWPSATREIQTAIEELCLPGTAGNVWRHGEDAARM